MIKKKIGVLISGNGSNLQALIDACARPDFPAEISVVISNRSDAYGINRAREHGIPAHIIDHTHFAVREAFENAIQEMLEHHNAEIVCLAGFMRLLSADFVAHWGGRMLNIHPSLLPQFKGAHAIRNALAAGARETGCTVHLVTKEVDAGPILMQARVPIMPGDTEETLRERIHEQEHRIYPQALKKIIEGRSN